MKRNKYKDYLWYTALAVFIICVIEGIFFYYNVDNPFLKVTLNIQNAIKAYKIDPDIKQKEAIAYMQATGGGILSGIITYVYCIAVIVAPFCTIGALTVLIRKPASYVRGLFSQRNKKRVLVIGEGKYKFPLIDALTKDCRVTVVESTILSDDKKLKYINKGVKFVQKYQDMHIKSVIKMLDMCKFSDVFLCDDNSIENIECLNAFTESFEKNIKASENKEYLQIHLCCNDNSMAELIRQYYDKIDTRTFDLDIVDVNKMAVNKMYKEHPVYTANKGDDYDVHVRSRSFRHADVRGGAHVLYRSRHRVHVLHEYELRRSRTLRHGRACVPAHGRAHARTRHRVRGDGDHSSKPHLHGGGYAYALLLRRFLYPLNHVLFGMA